MTVVSDSRYTRIKPGGVERYNIGATTLRKLATEAGVLKKIYGVTLIDIPVMDKWIDENAVTITKADNTIEDNFENI